MNYLFLYAFIHIIIGVISCIYIGCNNYIYIDDDGTRYLDGGFVIFGIPFILLLSPIVFIVTLIEQCILKFGTKIQEDYSKKGE